MANRDFDCTIVNIDGTVFFEDLLARVFQAFGVTRDKSLPDRYLATFLVLVDYICTSIIGDAVVAKIKRLPEGIAELYLLKADQERFELPYADEFVLNYLVREKVLDLTDDVFNTEKDRWCAEVFEYLVNMADLCVYFHESGHLTLYMDTVVIVGNSIHTLMTELHEEKIKSLEDYSAKVLTDPDNVILSD